MGSGVFVDVGMGEAVFVGTVTRVENKTAKDPTGREHIVGQTAYVQVDEAFKGAKAPQLIFLSYGTSCDVTYEEGQRRLFYARYSKQDKAWSIGGCDRSTLLQHAADDLLYLRGLPASAQKTRIAGELKTRDYKPLMGVKVKLIGESKTHEVFTNKDGVYEAYGLPAGKYFVEPETPLNLKLRFASGTLDPTSRDRSRSRRRAASTSFPSCRSRTHRDSRRCPVRQFPLSGPIGSAPSTSRRARR